MGLDYFPVSFEEVPREIIWDTASYGLPTRMSHWSFGKSFQHQKFNGEMGFGKIYELVINSNPSIALLDETNSDVSNLLICAHVLAHSDFFKNNLLFAPTNRNIINQAEQNAKVIDGFKNKYGVDAVEDWMDIAFSIDGHLDWARGESRQKYPPPEHVFRVKAPLPYADLCGEDSTPQVVEEIKNEGFPPHPEKDLLWFLINYAQMLPWQREVLSIIRSESFYFYPQGQCLTGDTYIFTSNGPEKIEDVITENGYLPAERELLSVNNKYEKTSHFYKKKANKIITITTALGKKISCTLEHPLQILKPDLNISMVNAEKLKCGDRVVIKIGYDNAFSTTPFSLKEFVYKEKNHEVSCNLCHRKLRNLSTHIMTHGMTVAGYKQAYGESSQIIAEDVLFDRSETIRVPDLVNEDFARLLGYFVSEGHWSKTSIAIGNLDKEVVDDIRHIYRSVFGITPTEVYRDDGFVTLSIANQKFFELLDFCGVKRGEIAQTKDIPKCILQSPKKIVISFLRGLFEGDGAHCCDGTIKYGTSSSDLAKQVHLLLLSLGIVTKIRYRSDIKFYDIIVLGSYRDKFLKQIGFITATKNACERIHRPSGIFLEPGIPYVKAALNHLRESISKSPSKFKKMRRESFPLIRRNEVGRTQWADIQNSPLHEIDSILYKKIKNLFIEENFYDEIVDISIVEKDVYVYDVTIPSNHLFISDGFVSHNTKIINEGHASFWHAEILLNYWNLSPEEHLEFAKTHSQVVRPGGGGTLNPYYVGFRVLTDIKKRWDKYYEEGQKDAAFQKSPEAELRDEKGNIVASKMDGYKKIFQVRAEDDDISFIGNYLTRELCEDMELFTYGLRGEETDLEMDDVILKDRELEEIKRVMVNRLYNGGVPPIHIVRADETGLFLHHLKSDKHGLDPFYARKTLEYVYQVWKHPVFLTTHDVAGGEVVYEAGKDGVTEEMKSMSGGKSKRIQI